MNYKRTVEDFKRCGSKSPTMYGLPYVSDCVGNGVERYCVNTRITLLFLFPWSDDGVYCINSTVCTVCVCVCVCISLLYNRHYHTDTCPVRI